MPYKPSTPDNKAITVIEQGSVTSPAGFLASGVTAGIKASGNPDIAILAGESTCQVAGVFTRNRVAAACVDINRRRLIAGEARALVVNAGNANCYTGERGIRDANEMCKMAAEALGVREELVFGASTGVIGTPLPMDKIASGIAAAASGLNPDGGLEAARAIMTTDTHPKSLAVRVASEEGEFTIGAIAKGSGMIEPNMATMFGFLTTDADIDHLHLQELLIIAVNKSFNNVTVDGDTSTNDMALLLASGASGVKINFENSALFSEALEWICIEMARMIAADGEGATKLVEVSVRGAQTDQDARLAAKTIANSPLVKTAIFGNDPNWGRILAAAGRSGAVLDPARLSLFISGECIVSNGEPSKVGEEKRAEIMHPDPLRIELDMGIGEGLCTVWTCDFSYGYVKINAEYHT